MTLLIAYIVFVLVGPVIFLGLIRPKPSERRFAIGCASAVTLMCAALLMRPAGQGADLATIGWLICAWLCWIVTIAMVVQALTLRGGFGWQRKWNAALGAAATIVPWFGLSLAITAAG